MEFACAVAQQFCADRNSLVTQVQFYDYVRPRHVRIVDWLDTATVTKQWITRRDAPPPAMHSP